MNVKEKKKTYILSQVATYHKWRTVNVMCTCTQLHLHEHHIASGLIVRFTMYPVALCFDCYSAQPHWIGGGKTRLDVSFIINIETRQVLLCHMASSSRGPRVKQHGERWDVITQSVCAILIKTLLTVLHYWNTPHRTLLNSLNKLAPALLIIHRTMSRFFFPSLPRRGVTVTKSRRTEGERCKMILSWMASHESGRAISGNGSLDGEKMTRSQFYLLTI